MLDVHVTEYGKNYTRGKGARGWLTYHGVEVVSTDCTVVYAAKIGNCLFGYSGGAIGFAAASLSELSITAALNHPDAAIRALALLDRRVGRGRLEALQQRGLHPIEAVMFMVRQHARGRRAAWPCCPGCDRSIFEPAASSIVRENCRDWSWLEQRESEAI